MTDRHYEELYNRLLDRSITMHLNNKKRIRTGLILLAALPVILITIRWLTDSDKVVFLIIWVICMFAICIYLISIEYIDDSLQKSLGEITDREAGLGELVMDSSELHDRVHERIHERNESIHERLKARHEEIQEHYVRHWMSGDQTEGNEAAAPEDKTAAKAAAAPEESSDKKAAAGPESKRKGKPAAGKESEDAK